MKFDSSDLMAVLRRFGEASEENMPRQIERIEKSKPHEKSTLFRFRFGKRAYALVVDNTAEDDEDFVLEQADDFERGVQYALLPNPRDDLASYGMPYKGKDCYLLRYDSGEQRLDVALVSKYGDKSRSTYQKMIQAGKVMVNGEVVTSTKHIVAPSDVLAIDDAETEIIPMDYEVIYEDDNVLVINKPSGMLTHAKGAINEEFTAAHIIQPKTTYKTDTNRPGIVHRLDRDTSGVLLMVKNDEAASLIQRQFSDRKVKKEYTAIVNGVPAQSKALIDLPIGRNPSSPSTFRVDANGKSAQTTYEVVQATDKHALVQLKPRTGRTHQLRVHTAYMGTPIVGDVVYGKEKADRMYLHAASLEVTLPGGVRKVFEAPVPSSFEDFLRGDD